LIFAVQAKDQIVLGSAIEVGATGIGCRSIRRVVFLGADDDIGRRETWEEVFVVGIGIDGIAIEINDGKRFL